jgi:hypothetical protein
VAKKNNPWDMPKTEPKGDAGAVALYHGIGVVLSEFEALQTKLTWLFCALVESDSVALKRAYGTLESVPHKTTMARYAAEMTLATHADLLARTKSVLTEIENFSQRRNDIAHAIVMWYMIDDVPLGFYLAPGVHVSKKTALFPGEQNEWADYMLTATQVLNFGTEFRRVGNLAEALATEIQSALKPPA